MQPKRLYQPWLASLVAATVCCTSLPAATALAAGATGLPVIVRPSDAAGNELSGPGYYEVTAVAGSSTQLYALVGNKSHQESVVSVVPVDAGTGVYGGITARLASQPRRQVGSWIDLSIHKVRLAPDKGEVVPFTLNVPKHTRPGQYVGALTAFVPSNRVQRGQGFTLTVQTRLADDVVVTVPGPQHQQFKITGESVARRTVGTYMISQIKNSGTMMLKGWGYLWVWQPGRRQPVLARPFRIDTTLPHSMVHYPLLLGQHPRAGQYSYKLKIWWNGGKTVAHGRIRIR